MTGDPTVEVLTAAVAEECPAPGGRRAPGRRSRPGRPGRLLPAVVGRPAVRRARRAAGGDRARPVERHAARRRARPAGRGRRPRHWSSPTPTGLARLDRGPATTRPRHPLARPMHYTSGTTGRAKGVWSGLWDGATAAAAFADEADQWSFGPDDVHLVCSPMYHSVSVRFAGGTLLRGGTCVILGHFDATDGRRRPRRGGSGPCPPPRSWPRPP